MRKCALQEVVVHKALVHIFLFTIAMHQFTSNVCTGTIAVQCDKEV